MSDTKYSHDHIESLPNGGQQMNQLTTVTLTAEQFESLYMQPRATAGSRNPLVGRVGNPTPLYASKAL